MGNSEKEKFRLLGIGLVLILIISSPFLHYYFWNFYTGSWEEYRRWYPTAYFVIFPVVKILPFVITGLIVWLSRRQLSDASRITGRWLVQNYQNVLLSFLVAIIVLAIGEFLLRKAGFKPGYRVYSQYFHPVDSLFLLDGFSADSTGIVKVSTAAREFICEELEMKNCMYDLAPLREDQSVEVYTLPAHFVEMYAYNYKSDFKRFINSLKYNPDTSEAEFANAVIGYSHCPINSDGFKSIEFKKYKSKKRKVLLIGDSFTWGCEASNFTNSFADLLLAKDYIVYNTGINGADPSQYLQIAKVLVTKLQPDYVVVNFYLGNDVMYFHREVQPFVPLYYCTNAGDLMACPEGIYFYNAEEAYEYTLAHYTIPQGDSQFNHWCSKTVLSTLIWNAVTDYRPEWTMSKYENYYKKVREVKTKAPYSDIQINEIKQITEKAGKEFILVVIPMFDGDKFIFPEDNPELLTGMEYHVPPITMEHYENRIDGHYNDLGHAMHANFIDSLLRKQDKERGMTNR